MKIVNAIADRLTGGCLMLALLVPSCALALPGPQEPGPKNQSEERQEAPATNQANQTTQPQPAVAVTKDSLPDSPGAGPYQVVAQAQTETETQPAPPPPPAQVQKPVGTAAAETSTTKGFAVSRPAGAALAPAKQKRSRTIIISVVAVVGAAVAVGAVAALSAGTPSKPPGAQ